MTRLTEEKTGIDISDSVVMGDVQQNILKTDVCPSCSASNVRVMKCQEVGCTSKQFCELCHINCRYSEGSSTRFDSGVGLGPLCSECLDAKFAAWKKRLEQLERERLERERLEREILASKARYEQERLAGEAQEAQETRERLAREARYEQERLERERLERERLERERREQQRRAREHRKKKIQVKTYFGFVLLWTIIYWTFYTSLGVGQGWMIDLFASLLTSATCCAPFCYLIFIKAILNGKRDPLFQNEGSGRQ